MNNLKSLYIFLNKNNFKKEAFALEDLLDKTLDAFSKKIALGEYDKSKFLLENTSRKIEYIGKDDSNVGGIELVYSDQIKAYIQLVKFSQVEDRMKNKEVWHAGCGFYITKLTPSTAWAKGRMVGGDYTDYGYKSDNKIISWGLVYDENKKIPNHEDYIVINDNSNARFYNGYKEIASTFKGCAFSGEWREAYSATKKIEDSNKDPMSSVQKEDNFSPTNKEDSSAPNKEDDSYELWCEKFKGNYHCKENE